MEVWKDGRDIEVFNSIKDALISLKKPTRDGNITRAIKNNFKAYGHKWRYILR